MGYNEKLHAMEPRLLLKISPPPQAKLEFGTASLSRSAFNLLSYRLLCHFDLGEGRGVD